MESKDKKRAEELYLNDLKRRLKKSSSLDILKSKRIYTVIKYSSALLLVAMLYICITPPDFAKIFLNIGEALFKLYTSILT